MDLGLVPGLSGGLSVRAKEQEEQARAEAAGGQGAAPEVPGSQPPANSEFFQHELGRASVSTPAHPPLPAWAPPSAGWEALSRPGTPLSALLGDDHTPLSLPGLCLARKGALWGVLLGGVMPFYHTSLPWIPPQLPFVA